MKAAGYRPRTTAAVCPKRTLRASSLFAGIVWYSFARA
jgi:hypothetical protein